MLMHRLFPFGLQVLIVLIGKPLLILASHPIDIAEAALVRLRYAIAHIYLVDNMDMAELEGMIISVGPTELRDSPIYEGKRIVDDWIPKFEKLANNYLDECAPL